MAALSENNISEKRISKLFGSWDCNCNDEEGVNFHCKHMHHAPGMCQQRCMRKEEVSKINWASRVDQYFADRAEEQRMQRLWIPYAEKLRAVCDYGFVDFMRNGSRKRPQVYTTEEFEDRSTIYSIDSMDRAHEKHRQTRIGTEFHGFLDLPLEIRQMIYRLLLVRGKVFVQPIRPDRRGIEHTPACGWRAGRYSEECECCISYRYLDWRRRSLPSRPVALRNNNALLHGVSKQVQVEATEVFYSAGNEFVLGYGQMWRPMCALCARTDLHSMYLKHDEVTDFIHVKRLSVCFDMRDTTTAAPGRPTLEWHKDNLGLQGAAFLEARSEMAFHTMEFKDKLELIHNVHEQYQIDNWVVKYLDLVTNATRFHYLQVDVTNCYCPLGCCRRTQDVCESLCDWENGFPQTLEILGATSAAEKEKMLDWLIGANPGVAVKNHVVFRDDERFWDPVTQNCFWKRSPST